MRHSRALALCGAIALLAGSPQRSRDVVGTFGLDVPAGPYISGSIIPVNSIGLHQPFVLSTVGAGRVEGTTFVAPSVRRPTGDTIVGGAAGAVAMQTIHLVSPPDPQRPLLAVATYRNGIALHDPRTFKLIGYIGIGGAPGDVAFASDGSILAPDTDGTTLVRAARNPWDVQTISGVALGNEVQTNARTGATFVSNRDVQGLGALTRILPDGRVDRVQTGETAEGIAIDPDRDVVYVGNVNSRDVAVVDARTMQVVQRIASVPRTFGITLDAGAGRLFVVSNTSPSMITHGGFAAAIDVRAAVPHIVAQSAHMTFPLGIARDERTRRLFVTDEAVDVVYVLSERTLRNIHAPLQTCDTPWRPLAANGRLYVPCAGADKVDVFDLRTLRRVRGAPFPTGGFPLSVASWP
jgi:DNA-binding beta-propeller fold protein YncE